MKKVFALMAIAAMTLVACNKPNNEDDPGQEGGDEKEYVAPIKIDGNFDDWAGLKDVTTWDQGEHNCIDLMCQGAIIDETGAFVDYAPGMYKYNAAPGTNEWAWEEQPASDFIIGKGNKKAYEFQITRELYPLGKLAKEFTMGIEILVNGWDATGALPNTEATDTNPAGEADLGVVKYTK